MVVVKSFKYEDVLGIEFGRSLFAKPKLTTHVYFVDGLLIDTAQSSMRKWVLNELKHLNVQQIFITHHHEDHSGNIKEVQKLFGVKVYASSLCAKMMKAPPAISFAQKMTWGDRPAYNDLIPNDGKVETEKYTFEVIPIPGHAKDMVALYEANQKWLFSADLYINSYIGYFLERESIATQIESTKKLLALDFEQLFCSHNPQLTNGRQQLKKKLQFLEAFYEEVAHYAKQGLKAQHIFKKMKLKENYFVKWFSAAQLSKLNMVKSAMRDLKKN